MTRKDLARFGKIEQAKMRQDFESYQGKIKQDLARV